MTDLKNLIETLHPLELKVLPYLSECKTLQDLIQKTKLQEIEVMRALQWMQNKNIIQTKYELKYLVQIDGNGIEYSKKGLPERRFLTSIKEKELSVDEIEKNTGLSKQELSVSIGLLKSKAAIDIKPGMIISLTANGRNLLEKETLEEKFLKIIAKNKVEVASLSPEEKFAYEAFLKRKGIVKTILLKTIMITVTDTGKKLAKIKPQQENAIDRVTPELLKTGKWRGQAYRRYDVKINVPQIYGGKRHFVKQAIHSAKTIWLDMGFKEMNGPLLNTSFWNFDALFTAQDHPVRELQDTFYIKEPAQGRLPDKKLVEIVKKSHESGVSGSTGWRYQWKDIEARKNVMRTHTTVLSARTIAALKQTELPAKFFAVGRCFRNETLDWSHLFEFNQTEGIVVDPDANFRDLLGYLKEFFTKMGFPKARFRPAFFPYTEPSVEIDVFHPVHKKWIELGGAGMFRPEVVVPLLGKDVPVLALGPGFDRIIMDYYKITDIRDLYKNDLKQMREMKAWMR
jgi:phenylalanyl-tRNA synthetase alpha chain